MFGPEDFLNSSYDVTLDTKIIPIPPGEYVAQIKVGDGLKLTKDTIKKEGSARIGEYWARLDISLDIADPTGALKQTIERDPRIVYGLMLDLDAQGNLDVGKQKNIRLGQLLAAAGLPEKGWSFGMLAGKNIRIKTVVSKSINGNDFAEVVQVTKA